MKKRWLGFIGAAAVFLLAGGAIAMAASDSGSPTKAPLPQADALQQAGRPWLGITIVQGPDGLTVSSVIADSPADTAGLQRGDVVTAVGGTAVSNMQELRDQVKDKADGDTVALTVKRNGQTLNVNVTLEEHPDPIVQRPQPFPELEGILKDGLFDHILGSQLNLTDKDGNPVTLNITVGTVAGKTDSSLTVTPNDGSANKTYQVGDDTLGKRILDQLENGDKVVVVTVGNGADARVIAPARLAVNELLPGFEGLPGHPGKPQHFGMRGMQDGKNGPAPSAQPGQSIQ